MPVQTRSQTRNQISHTAYKLVFVEPNEPKNHYNVVGIAELGIPTFGRNNESRIVSNRDYAKYRCDRAFVKKITSLDGKIEYCQAYSVFHKGGYYYTGHWIEADSCEDNLQEVCCPGIHYYLNRDAVLHLVHSQYYKNPLQLKYKSNRGYFDINPYCPFKFNEFIWFDDDGARQLVFRYSSPHGLISKIVNYCDKDIAIRGEYYPVKYQKGRYTIFHFDNNGILINIEERFL